MIRLARARYDSAIVYLKGGFEAWKKAGKEIDTIESISMDDLADRLTREPGAAILDVRKNLNTRVSMW